MTELIRFVNQFQELDQETEEAIKSYFGKEIYKKNEFILEEGKVCAKISFIKSGLVRRFYVDDGDEITKWLYHENHWIGSLSSYFNQKPSFEFFRLVKIPRFFRCRMLMNQNYWNIRSSLNFTLNFFVVH